jgi:hypothetical protein
MFDFDILPASNDVYNFRTGKWKKLASGPNVAPNMAYLGWGIYVMKTVDGDAKRHKAAWSAAAHLGVRDLSMWAAAYPSGFQPYRKRHTNLNLWASLSKPRASWSLRQPANGSLRLYSGGVQSGRRNCSRPRARPGHRRTGRPDAGDRYAGYARARRRWTGNRPRDEPPQLPWAQHAQRDDPAPRWSRSWKSRLVARS